MDRSLERLPKWAQEQILNLRRRLEDCEKLLKEVRSTDPTRISYGYHHGEIGKPKGYIPDQEHVRFVLNSRHEGFIDFRASYDEEVIRVAGGDLLEVLPSSGNAITLRLRKR